MSFKVLTLKEEDEWNSKLALLPLHHQDVYYTPEYYRLYEENGDGIAKCFVFENNKHIALYPFLLNSVNDIGFKLDKEYYDIQGAYGYNGVVSTSSESEFSNNFYKTFNKYCIDNNIIAEFTRFHPLLNNIIFSEKNLEIRFDRKTVYLDLSQSYESIFSNFQTTTRKQIKRASNRHKIQVIIAENSSSTLESLMTIYTDSMNRVGAPKYLYFSEKYFESLLKINGSLCIFAIYRDLPIAVITGFYNQTYFHGHLGGTLKDYIHLSPFSFLYNTMVKIGIKKSCKYLHVGGGATNKPEDPLFKFKTNFSKNFKDFFIGKKIHNIAIYRLVTNQWQRKFPGKPEIFGNLILKYRY